MNFIIWIIVGVLAGYLSGIIWKGGGFGFAGNLILGICGALIGGFIFKHLGLHFHGFIGHTIAALAGALLLLWIISLIKK